MRLAWDIFPVRAIPFGPLFILIDLLFVHIYILFMRPIKLKEEESYSKAEVYSSFISVEVFAAKKMSEIVAV